MTKFPVAIDVISCTGELVTLTGEETIGTHISEDAQGGFHIKFSIETRGLKGVGLVSGKSYTGAETTENSAQIPLGASSASFVNSFSIVRQGDDGTLVVGDDLRIKQLFLVMFNSMGAPTAFKDEFEVDCT